MRTADEKRLRAALAEHDLELVSVGAASPDGTMTVAANKLYPVPGPGGNPVYAPIPVSVRIQSDASGSVRILTGDEPEELRKAAWRALRRSKRARAGEKR